MEVEMDAIALKETISRAENNDRFYELFGELRCDCEEQNRKWAKQNRKWDENQEKQREESRKFYERLVLHPF